MSLTEGAVAKITSGEASSADLKPTLQVTELKLVQTKQAQQSDRYRLLLSDGSHLQQAMLGTQINHLVKDGNLRIGSIVQLVQYTCTTVQSRMIIIILELVIVATECALIGNPMSAQKTLGPSQFSADQPVNNPANPQSFGSGSVSGGMAGSPNLAQNPRVSQLHTSPYSSNYDSGRYGSSNALPSHVKAEPSGGLAGSTPINASHSNNLDSGRYGASNALPSHVKAEPIGGLAGSNPINASHTNNLDSGRYGASNAPPSHLKAEPGARISGSTPMNASYHDQSSGFYNGKPEISHASGTSTYPSRPSYQQPSPMYSNRGPVARNEAPPRIMPISALNPYQGRWTIKARVTAKGELRHYNNPRGDGKVFSFDLLDADGGEIRVTCFNAVADQFYSQIEAGKVYLISRGNLKPAQKNFNHLNNDLEIFLENGSVIQQCFEDDSSIPRQQFHYRTMNEVEGMDNNSVVDIIGVVTSVTPVASIMRKNGTETQKRSLQLKDMSGRSVELTLWGNFCNAEGLRLQNMCDSGCFPILAVKACRVNDFNGKAIGTISTSQLFIEPDFPEGREIKEWFEKEGRTMPSVSISREISSVGRTDIQKTISQIKDEKLGTSEKPDWITVVATVIFIRAENFCYTACPIMVGDRQCNKKVTNNGDGKWRCERCDQTVDECDYRYLLGFQLQDHTGITWATAFQEGAEDIMGISAKDLHFLKYEKQDDEGFAKILRQVLFRKFQLKLKVKEETYSDEQRVKCTVIKAEKVNYSSYSRFLLDTMEKLKSGNFAPASNVEFGYANTRTNQMETENVGGRQGGLLGSSQMANKSYATRESGSLSNPAGQYGNQLSTRYPTQDLSCNSCGATGHNSSNCPSIMYSSRQPGGSGLYPNRGSTMAGSGGGGGECFKCHQPGHWARDCPGLSSVPPAYGSSAMSSGGRFGSISRQQVGGF